MKADNNWK